MNCIKPISWNFNYPFMNGEMPCIAVVGYKFIPVLFYSVEAEDFIRTYPIILN